MADRVKCERTDVHNFHEHFKEVSVFCSGILRCGTQDHEAHRFVETQRQRCPGICGCGSGRLGSHGPGEHK